MTAGWQHRSLGEVCNIRPPKSEARERLSGNDEVSFVPMEDLGIDQKVLKPTQIRRFSDVSGSYTYFADGDVLLAKITPCFENGKLGIAEGLNNGVGFGSSEFVVFRPSDRLSKEWLYYFLCRESFRQEGAERMTGAVGHKRISKDFIEGCQIPIPSRSEQQRIVAILDEAFEGIATAKDNAERNLRNSKGVFDSYLQAVFSFRNKKWKEIRLGDIVTRLTNGYVGPTRNIYQDSGIPYLLARHVKNNVLSFDGKTFVSDAFNQKNKKSILKAGDVLLVQSGHIGHSAVVTPDHQGHNCHAMIVITPVDTIVSGDFLSLYFNSPEMRCRFDNIRSGSTVPHLTCGEVRELTIPVPDLATQRGVIAHASALQAEVRRLVSVQEAKQSKLVDLRQSLLHHAFSGQL